MFDHQVQGIYLFLTVQRHILWYFPAYQRMGVLFYLGLVFLFLDIFESCLLLLFFPLPFCQMFLLILIHRHLSNIPEHMSKSSTSSLPLRHVIPSPLRSKQSPLIILLLHPLLILYFLKQPKKIILKSPIATPPIFPQIVTLPYIINLPQFFIDNLHNQIIVIPWFSQLKYHRRMMKEIILWSVIIIDFLYHWV